MAIWKDWKQLSPDLDNLNDDIFGEDPEDEKINEDIVWDEDETPPSAWNDETPPLAWNTSANDEKVPPVENTKISPKDDDLVKELKGMWFTEDQINSLEDDELIKMYEEKLKESTTKTTDALEESEIKLNEAKNLPETADSAELKSVVSDLHKLNQRISSEHNITVRENERLLEKIKSFESRDDERANDDIYNRVHLKGIKEQPQVVLVSKLLSRIKAWDENAKDSLFDAVGDILYEGTGQNFSELMDIAKEKRAWGSALLNKKEWWDINLDRVNNKPSTEEEDPDSVI